MEQMFLLKHCLGAGRTLECSKAGRSQGVGLAALLLLALLACKNKEQQPPPEQPIPALPQVQNPQGNVPAAAQGNAPRGVAPQVAQAPLGFTLSHSSINQGESIKLTFSRAVQPTSGKNWVTIVASGKPDNDWGEWKYVPAGATSIELTPKSTGSLEVRLHDTYPDHKFGVLQRASLNVKAKAKAKPKTACVDGQTQACPCGDGTFGRRTCDRGKWPSGCFLCD